MSRTFHKRREERGLDISIDREARAGQATRLHRPPLPRQYFKDQLSHKYFGSYINTDSAAPTSNVQMAAKVILLMIINDNYNTESNSGLVCNDVTLLNFRRLWERLCETDTIHKLEIQKNARFSYLLCSIMSLYVLVNTSKTKLIEMLVPI